MWSRVPLLLAGLDAFYREGRRCGEPDTKSSEVEAGWVVMACSCSAQLGRRMGETEFLDR